MFPVGVGAHPILIRSLVSALLCFGIPDSRQFCGVHLARGRLNQPCKEPVVGACLTLELPSLLAAADSQVVNSRHPFSRVFGGFLKRRIPEKNGKATLRLPTERPGSHVPTITQAIEPSCPAVPRMPKPVSGNRRRGTGAPASCPTPTPSAKSFAHRPKKRRGEGACGARSRKVSRIEAQSGSVAVVVNWTCPHVGGGVGQKRRRGCPLKTDEPWCPFYPGQTAEKVS